MQISSSIFSTQSSSNRNVEVANKSIIEIEQMKSLLFLGIRGEITGQENKDSGDIAKDYFHTVDFLV